MAIATPTTVSQPALSANKVWVANLSISAPDPNKPVVATAVVVPLTDDNTLINSQRKVIVIPDVLTTAQTDQNMAQAVTAIYAAISAQIQAKNPWA